MSEMEDKPEGMAMLMGEGDMDGEYTVPEYEDDMDEEDKVKDSVLNELMEVLDDTLVQKIGKDGKMPAMMSVEVTTAKPKLKKKKKKKDEDEEELEGEMY